MGSEIKSVTNSLLRLGEETKDYDFIDIEDFEHLSDTDEALEMNRVYNTFLRWVEVSKNITEIELNSPEYQRQSEMAMQAVKKIIQLQTKK